MGGRCQCDINNRCMNDGSTNDDEMNSSTLPPNNSDLRVVIISFDGRVVAAGGQSREENDKLNNYF